EITVVQFTSTEQGQPKALLPPGTVIIAEAGGLGMTRFTKKGGAELGAKELPATLALMKFFGLQASGGTLDDLSMFATDEKQPVGGTWPLNRQELLKAVQRAPQGLALNPDAASGNGKLVAVVKEGGKDHLDMEFTLKIDMKPGDTPGGGK